VSRRRLATAAAATLVGVALMSALGLWQLRRLAWKEALIAAAETRARAAPVAAPAPAQWPALAAADYEYRRVAARGVYDFSEQKFLFAALEAPRGRYGGVGFFVMTPLRLSTGEAVIVNRGFVPEEQKANAESGPRGEVAVVGLMRASEPRHWFTPADDLQRGVFFLRDVEAMAAAMRLGAHAPFVIDGEAGPEPLPQGGETRLSFVNNHLAYAFTWFAMAAALACVFAVWAYGDRRR
jgi:surfeit locus 1 family protein